MEIYYEVKIMKIFGIGKEIDTVINQTRESQKKITANIEHLLYPRLCFMVYILSYLLYNL